ncbi:hypothetical protein HQN89_08695 [Paenibacillus frigoriresistens]|uniref:hypothetical protein n=1 Tax=Paenibacillus alginolyticus TaxID=59839 RepID=UPI00156505B7|nr:hypothetical protein [Paenibacillus frigoriresistens]NRF91095.1 hypothetical protein [Paenibacillus frigoriresistens]
MKLKIAGIIVGILTLMFELSTSAEGIEAGIDPSIHNIVKSKHVTVVSIPGLSFMELRPDLLVELPHLRRLTELSAVGAMNIRTSSRTMRDVYVSLGAGAPSVGVADVQAFAAKETRHGIRISELMNRYIGRYREDKPIEIDSVLVPDITMLQRANKNQGYVTGILGELLKEYGVFRSVLGSSDLGKGSGMEDKKLRRYSPLMLMDANGFVDKGALGDDVITVVVDRTYGVSTNYAQLRSLWEKRIQPGITLVELGDLYRLYTDQEHYNEERFTQLKGQILKEIDQWIGQVVAGMAEEDSLWIFSPEVNSEASRAKAYLSPILHYTTDSREAILVSESTRRQGVVTAQDFSSSLLKEFNIPVPSGLMGIPLSYMGKSDVLADLVSEQSSMQMIYRSRPLLLYPFVTYEMLILLLSLMYGLWIKKRLAGPRYLEGREMPWRRSVRTLLFSLLTAPAVMLLMGWLVVPLTTKIGIESTMLVLIAVFIVCTLLISAFMEKCRLSTAMIWLGLGNALIITLDGSTGAHAMKYSILGYDPMIGARYYGIGNEYMGVLIGALVLGVTAALQRRHGGGQPVLHGLGGNEPLLAGSGKVEGSPRLGVAAASPAAALLACGAFLLVTACLAAPSLGANAGGALSAAVAFGVAGAHCFAGERWRELRLGRGAALLSVLLALGLGALWLLNSADSPAAFARESHVGRAFQALHAGHFDQIGQLIERKLRMNVHLLRASVWSKVLITSLIVMAVLVLRPRGHLRSWQHKYPYWMYGFSANMIGAIAALLLNDSGIVAAATLIIFVAVPMQLLRLQELEASK